MTTEYVAVLEAARASLIGRSSLRRPRIGIVLGSGLGGVIQGAQEIEDVPFAEIPGFVEPAVEGHAGTLSFCRLGGVESVVLQGRAHLYGGHTPQSVVHPVRLLGRLGVETVVLTNAAGGLSAGMHAGDIVCIADHLNLTGANPLTGPDATGFGERFPVMAGAYDPALRALAKEVGAARGIDLKEGVYAGVSGPSFETPAEVRALALLGADVVGMSTVLETIAARQMGMRVVALSLVTNVAGADDDAGHGGVLAAGEAAAAKMTALIIGLVSALRRTT